MIFHPDKRLLWHPRYDNKFVVGGGTQITLYECASEYPEIRHVTSQHDLTHMKCFAWSPDPAFDDLLAVGNRDGKVELIRLEAGKQSLRANALSSGSRVTLPARTSRNVHALAFSDAEPSHLAVGTDKYRGESSVVIWNVNSLAPALQLTVNDYDDGVRLDSTHGQRRTTMFPRVDNQPQRDSRIISQHSPAEVVSSLAFVPRSAQTLAAALSFRWLRMLDLRAKPGAMLNQVATKAHTIAMDPFDEYRVACTAEDTVNIWDRRKLATPVLTFAERDAIADGARFKAGTPIATLEFSSTRRGCLATLERDSSYVRFWDLTQCRAKVIDGILGGSSDAGDARSNKDAGQSAIKRTGWGRGWLSNADQPNPLRQSPKEGSTAGQVDLSSQAAFVISDTRRTKYFPRSLSSFALAPNRTGPSLTSNVMVVNKEGDLELYAIHDTKKQLTWSARGDLGIGAGLGLKILEGYHEGETDDDEVHAQRRGSRVDSPLPPHLQQRYGARASSRSRSRASRGDSVVRGRLSVSADPTERTPRAPFFGRGDEDGFPALPSQQQQHQQKPVPTGLSATRPGQLPVRNYSPASVRQYRSNERGEPSALLRRSLSRVSRAEPGAFGGDRSRNRRRSVDRQKNGAKKGQKKQGVESVVQDDVSMLMRRRAKAGYGLSLPRENIALTQGDDDDDVAAQMLSDLWSWIHMSNEVLCVPTCRVHGYDFSYQGLQGIWEGFGSTDDFSTVAEDTPVAVGHSLLLDTPVNAPHHTHAGTRRSRSPGDDLHGNWAAAIATLGARRNLDRWSWKSPVSTGKLLQRKLALLTCGWSLREDEISATITRFERDGEISKAACWLVFTGQANKAVELLMRSDDDTHQMMSGTVAALAPLAGRNLENRGHFAHLILRLHDPYLRMMLAHLAMGDWAEVLDEDVIPFRERLIIALQFLDDKALSSYLRRTVENAAKNGDIDALVVTGLTKDGMRILQAYVDRTGDIQSAAILSSYVCPLKFKDKRADRWLEAYRDLLDGFKLHHLRVGFDIERGQIIQSGIHNGDLVPEEWAPRQILIRCHYCNKPVRNPGMLMSMQQKGKPTACENCNRELPRCSVCLITLSIVHDAAREVELGYTHHRDTFDDAIVICQTCRHGGHAVHILEWFLGEDTGRTHDVCPVADCNCRCADEF